jgi:hypothetical protein
MATRVPVVFNPCPRKYQAWIKRQTTKQYICEKEEGKQVHESIGKVLVCLQRSPDLMFV